MTTQFKAHDSYLLKCVLSPNVQHLVTTGSDKTAKVCVRVTLLTILQILELLLYAIQVY
jgi:hypothetical protein